MSKGLNPLHGSQPCHGKGAYVDQWSNEPCHARPLRTDGSLVKSPDNPQSTGKGNGKSLQYSCHEKPMSSMKRQKDMTPEDKPHCQKVSNMLLGKSWGQLLIALEENDVMGPKWKLSVLWVCPEVRVKPWCCKEQYCIGTWNVRPMNWM